MTLIRNSQKTSLPRALIDLLPIALVLTAGVFFTSALPAHGEDKREDKQSETKEPDIQTQTGTTVDNHRAAKANRLAGETSPYLLMHAYNPVDWYPWGPEAFERAKRENKPIFLSIGYSSCYWCHVMERESFMDPEIAKFLNTHFVCIKVDREERPDVDDIYMTAIQLLTQR
ncbi:MAG: thioredoxin domain-containing protein, partial [Pirellulales bacterium]|nr:thioredoxin domain-containing protein [Pirellulales bacterium]